jgi:hypothetical protein
MIFTIIARAVLALAGIAFIGLSVLFFLALVLAVVSAMTKIDQADSNEIEEVQIGDPS